MKLHYFHAPQGNFGDDINGWMWSSLMPECRFDNDDKTVLVGIGTIINPNIPNGARKIVFSSGAGYSPTPHGFGGSGWDIVCVRGPLTASVLGLPKDSAVTDGAILLRLLPEGDIVPVSERHGVVFMPHVGAALETGNWADVCKDAGIEFLDPRDDCKKTIDRMRHAKLVLADAMHAAIVADTLRVPWVPLVSSGEINSFKWIDWAASMGMSYTPIVMPPSTLLAHISNIASSFLGKGHFVGGSENMVAVLDQFHCMCSRKRNPLRRFVDRVINKLYRVFIMQPLLSGALDPISRYLNATYHAQAVETLRKAATKPGFLSEDTMFKLKLDEMASRLEKLRGTLA